MPAKLPTKQNVALLLVNLLVYFRSAEAASAQALCQDDSTFNEVPITAIRSEICSWIDSDPNDTISRRKVQCDKKKRPKVVEACQRACGVCCGDNKDASFSLKMLTEYYDDTADPDMQFTCDSIAGQSDATKKLFCETTLSYTCPATCGLCPTSPPTPSPTASATSTPTSKPTTKPPSPTVTVTVPVPTPTVTSGTGGEGDGGDTPNVASDNMTVFFSSEIYSSEKLDTADSASILTQLNAHFDVTSDTYQNSKTKESLTKYGIKEVSFTSLKVNDDVQIATGAKCDNTPPAGAESLICNTGLGECTVKFDKDSRRVRRLEKTDQKEVIKGIQVTLTELNQEISSSIDKVGTFSVVDIADDMESISDSSKSVAGLSGQDPAPEKKVGLQYILVPIFCGLLAILLLGVFIKRRKQKNIIVELEETDDRMYDNTRKYDNTREYSNGEDEVMFPVASEDQNYLPDLDCLCGNDNGNGTEVKRIT